MSTNEFDVFRVISTPKMHYWQRFKKLIGLNYEWYCKMETKEEWKI